jgi:prepilin-type N-terminal cleavage/methylation domain-containing protein
VSAPILERLRDDRGATLLELLVAMVIMVVFFAIFGSSMIMMSRAQSKTSAIVDTSDQLNRAFIWLDKNVRYSAAITTPGKGATDWYVELENTTSGTEVCTQIRYDVSSGQLQQRSWSVVNSAATTATSWIPIASSLTYATDSSNNTLTPFVSPSTATGSETTQQLQVYLASTSGPTTASATSQSTFTFTAINSTLPKSSASICQEAGRP